MNIYQSLPNSEKYSFAIDDRGIILEGPVDPIWKLTFEEMVILYWLTDKMIDSFVEGKFEEAKWKEIHEDTKRE
jgi:hypothetical protein